MALALSISALVLTVAQSVGAASAGPGGVLISLFAHLLPMVLVGGAITALVILYSSHRRSAEGGNGQTGAGEIANFARSRAQITFAAKSDTRFADVAGVDEAKEDLCEVVDFLKHPQKYVLLGARMPKGLLLVGPPGTGKTLLARAVAGEAGVPFLSISGSEFVEIYVGVGAARVRDLFEQAKKNAPCIVFIDEIDAVGRHRTAGVGGGNDERDQTLNQILVQMDGFDARTNVIVLAATNRPDVLDQALLRPGRFDRQLLLDRPDLKSRLAILQVHARGKPLHEDVDLELLARLTPGFSGADLENLLNEAALLAARKELHAIGQQDLEEAIDRVLAGPRCKSRIVGERERKLAAYHEAGHAVVAHALAEGNHVQRVTIIPRGLTGGYTRVLPDEESRLLTRSELARRLAWALGGYAAEQVAFGEVSTGAGDDLEQANEMAHRMVAEYGMSERLGPLTFGHREGGASFGRAMPEQHDHSDEMAYAVDREVRTLVRDAGKTARAILLQQRDKLTRLAEALVANETLEGEQLTALLGGSQAPGPAPAAGRRCPILHPAAGYPRGRSHRGGTGTRAAGRPASLTPPGRRPRYGLNRKGG
ncbi:MAG: ATP-dependent zinc metalloprotease FtsH [Dehalococcoidales bacterium]|nr:ATP-dependent zinc metalloprotease FtsH [Dehalococcoidales bacterium]